MDGFICGPSIYEYKGWLFEVHSYHGPWPLKKDTSPRLRAGEVFWNLWEEFNKLPIEEQVNFRYHKGGCKPL